MKPPARRPAAPPVRAVLGIETSTPHGGTALASVEGRLLAQRWAFAGNGYSRRLLGSVDAMLAESGLAPGDLGAIAVTRGPGSFTGVRVGLTTAKTLAHALGIPLFCFSTLEMLARRCSCEGRVAAMLDARRGEVYSALYERKENGSLEALRAEHVESCASFLDSSVLNSDASPIHFTGDAVPANRDLITDRLGDRARFVLSPWNLPAADFVALAGAQALAGGLPGTNPLEAAPEYLRASDAERGLAART